MTDDLWKRRDVVAAFLNQRSAVIPDRARQMEVILRLLRAAPRAPRRVLDLGAGDAIILATVLEAFPEASGVAVDYSAPMLEQARVRLAPFGPRATIVTTDLATPDWRQAVPGAFDAVVSSYAIHHLTHDRKRALYGEVFGLLSPGGTFINCEHVASPSPRVERMFDEAMSEHLWERRRERGVDVTPEQVLEEYMNRPDRAANILALVEDQCRWLREIGFGDVDCHWKYFELAIFAGIRPV